MNTYESERREFKGKTLGYVSAALGLVAGLAWNDAIGSLIEAAFPLERNTIAVKLLYALAVTIAVFILVKSLDRFVTEKDNSGSGVVPPAKS